MAVPTFLIKNASENFVNKQKNLFDLLTVVEKEKGIGKNNDEFSEIEENKSRKRQRRETKPFRGKESLFKEPVDLPLRFKKSYKMPDFQRNPHKWTKYSLADITEDDMSYEGNKAAALSFLKGVKEQKNKSIKMEVDEPVFKPPSSNSHQFILPERKIKKETNEPNVETERDVDKPLFKGGKLIMPEYVVGLVKKPNKKLKKKEPMERRKEVFLNHIHEIEDE